MEHARNQDGDLERFSFGPFVLSVPERMLLRNGMPVLTGSRSLDLLIALIRVPGRVVSKRELIELVWRGLIVDEGALRVHIHGLRKALGDGQDGARYIANVPGQGYSFVAAVDGPGRPAKELGAVSASQPNTLPPVLGRMVGRSDIVGDLVTKIRHLRIVSLVGPGGIGKTTVAIKVLHELREHFDGYIYFANLSEVTDPRLVHLTVASMLGANKGAGSPLSELIDFLKHRECLLVLDSCEHVIESVAALASTLMAEAPFAHLLTTTREPLRVEGEQVVRLPSLDCPPEGVAMTAAEISAFPAVELFVERVSANVADFKLTEENAPIVAEICRKLDGVALSLELSAGRVEAYGVVEMAKLLERRFSLLWRGRRTAPPRHQTLHATLEWSYGLLEEAEQTVFARLAIFAGPFTLNAAEAAAADNGVTGGNVVDIVAGLVAKSLLSPIAGRSPQRYRLLDTTRTYALEKLAGREDRDNVARRHAQFFITDLQSVADSEAGFADRFMESLSDVRSAFEWCFIKGGDASVGVALAAAAAAPLIEHSLCGECQRWTELAITSLTPSQQGTALELELQISLGWSAMFTAGKGQAGHGAFLRGLEIAESDRDPHQQLRLLNGLSYVLSRNCDFAGGLALAQQSAEVARQTSDASVIALADWAVGVCHHLCGHQGLVRSYCDSALSPPMMSLQARKMADHGFDYRGRALVALARTSCLLGFPNQAARTAQFAITVAEGANHPLSLFVVLIHATVAFIWCNEWRLAEATIGRLRSNTQTHTLIYRNMGAALEAVLNCRRRTRCADIPILRECLNRLVEERHLLLVPICRTTLADALLQAGSVNEAREIIDTAMEDHGPEFICAEGPEVLRIKGEITAALGHEEASEGFLLQAVELARVQSALWWELRAATSLARVRIGRGHAGAAAELESVVDRLSEGRDTDDYKAAEAVLDRPSTSLGHAIGAQGDR